MNMTISETLATVAVRVDYDNATEAGVVAVLLDLLASAGVRATWFVPEDADRALGDRLFFSGHATEYASADAAVAPSRLADDPIGWLHDVQIAVGRALEQHAHFELGVPTAALARAASMAAVAEALDLVTGLVRAGRLRVELPAQR